MGWRTPVFRSDEPKRGVCDIYRVRFRHTKSFHRYIRTQTTVESSRCSSLQKWSLLSLLHESMIPDSILHSYIAFVGSNFTSIILSDNMIESLVDRLLSVASSCEGFQLIFHILHLTQHSESLRLRCIMLVIIIR